MLEVDEKPIVIRIEFPRYLHRTKEGQSNKCEVGTSIDRI